MQSYSTTDPYYPENLEDYAPWVAMHGLRAPYGECQCGCRRKTGIVARTNSLRGYKRGEPSRFSPGHNTVKERISPSRIRVEPGTRAILLTKNKFAIVDADDFEWLSQFNWYAQWNGGNWYAAHKMRYPNGTSRHVTMHRLIVEAKDVVQVDHIDGHTLHNTRRNLRIATKAQNMQNRPAQRNNTSGYKGVTWHKDRRKWVAQIGVGGRMKYLGIFESIEEAAAAYDRAARELHGEFARTNGVSECRACHISLHMEEDGE